MRPIWLAGTLLLISLTACRTRAETRPLQTALDQQLASNARRHGIAGQAVLIIDNGKTIYRGVHGLAHRDTNQPVRLDDVFPVYSVSKLFVSILVMQLIEQGQLDLKAPIGSYLADLPARWRSLTLEQILDHVSGLPEYFETNPRPTAIPATRDAAFKQLADKPFVFATGTETQYNQTNFLLLGAILEAKYKQPYRRIATERIIEPLGLRDTYLGKGHAPKDRLVGTYTGKDHELVFEPIIDWPEYAIVHAELYTTLDDMGRFLTAVADGRLVKRETLKKLWTPYRYPQGGTGGFAAGWNYGTTGAYRRVGHGGGNTVIARLMFDEAFQDVYGCVYFTNGSAENVWLTTLVDSVMAVVAPQKFR